MILSSDDLPEPFRPSTPILARRGKSGKTMSSKIAVWAARILLTLFMV
jgi:hypothetical protein